MDRISDSGSDDLGSNPGGITKAAENQRPFFWSYPKIILCSFFLYITNTKFLFFNNKSSINFTVMKIISNEKKM
jgi:hypothetical protein